MKNYKVVLLLAVLLLLAACGGATVTVTPSSATTTASGDSITLTAAGGSGITWSLSPELGSLSASSGTSVTYTPPERVEASQAVTVTASSGSASASATITVEPLIVSVTGTVLDSAGAPAEGVDVAIVGYDKTTTDSEGHFVYSDVIAPYEVVIKNSDTSYDAYGTLTKSDPVLFSNYTGTYYRADLEGTVSNTTAGNALGIQLVSRGGLLSTAYDSLDDNTDYSRAASLITPTASGHLYALEWTEDTDGYAADFTGYAAYPDEVFLAAGGTFVGLDMSLDTVGSTHNVGVSFNLPSGASISSYAAGVRFAQEGEIAWPLLTQVDTSPDSDVFTIRSPGLSNAYVQVTAMITVSSSSSSGGAAPLGLNMVQPAATSTPWGITWNSVPATSSSLIVSFPATPELQQPEDGAGGVTGSTIFDWDGDAGALSIVSFSGPLNITYYTSGNTARLPDLSAFGVSYSSGDSYTWSVSYLRLGGYLETLDQYTSQGMISPGQLVFPLLFGLSPVSAEGYIAISPSRSFTIQ